MDIDEANAIGKIVSQADEGCSICVQALVDELNETFPAFVWKMLNPAPDQGWGVAVVACDAPMQEGE